MGKMLSKQLVLFCVFVLFCAFFALADSSAARQRTARDDRSSQKKSTEKKEKPPLDLNQICTDIDEALVEMLGFVKEGKDPDGKKVQAVRELLQQNRNIVVKLKTGAPKMVCQYQMLNAWTYYFETVSDPIKALQSATAAYRADPTNNDANITQAAIAVLYDKKPIAMKKPAASTSSKVNSRRQGRKGRSEHKKESIQISTQASSGNILNVDAGAIDLRLIGKKIEPLQLNCMNSGKLIYDQAESNLCILFWQLGFADVAGAEPNEFLNQRTQRQPQYNEQNVSNESISSQMSAFGEMFSAAVGNPELKFVAINTNRIEHKKYVDDKLLATPQPWPQVMAAEPGSGAEQFADLYITEPIMAIVTKTGTIKYAGPATGFLAPMVLRDLGGETTETTAPVTPDEITPAPWSVPKDSNTPGAAKSTPPSPQPRRQPQPDADKFDQLAVDVQAGKLLEHAKMFIDASRKRFNTPKKGIELCRQIIREYPGTKYAEEARMLLRRVPERYHQMYGITNEELGL